ncbi:replication initiation and membrane attachment family protein [Guptibacillus hwajinpoensis]|uniref:Replication initiation and membrane attachment protein n=1 Tax=Guptibacillus hwajinpoensis TaxID=208199 RepID=A0ABU0JW81_9BACL|nr:DnaD domain protein [Alkalihalobacillus hemicentroti]MDQ0481338.1 replication initiation and membrane attachment protein [Alkalihalobacillus hemicentroti]
MHWKELLPVDTLQVEASGLLHEYDRRVLTLLYQPLIGAGAYSLYMTLWSAHEQKETLVTTMTHHNLLLMMRWDLKRILEERRKLEGIGLLRTYLKSGEDPRHFTYELQPPLTPDRFFNDGVLNIYLFNRLGRNRYNDLKQHFTVDKLNPSEYSDITASFNEVYDSLHPSEMTSLHEEEENHDAIERRSDNKGLIFTSSQFDFEVMKQHISDMIVSDRMLTDNVKKTIERLAFVYKIEPYEMGRIVEQAAIHHEELSDDLLRKEVSSWFALENRGKVPALQYRRQPTSLQEFHTKEPVTEEEKAAQRYEQMTPYDILQRAAEGGKPSEADMKLVERIMDEQKLTPGVMNVLLDFILETQDKKLSKNYVEKFASHWARAGVKTVRDAMNLAIKELQQPAKPKGKSGNSNSRGKSTARKDKVPEWISEQKEPDMSKEERSEKQDQLKKMLSKYKK